MLVRRFRQTSVFMIVFIRPFSNNRFLAKFQIRKVVLPTHFGQKVRYMVLHFKRRFCVNIRAKILLLIFIFPICDGYVISMHRFVSSHSNSKLINFFFHLYVNDFFNYCGYFIVLCLLRHGKKKN